MLVGGFNLSEKYYIVSWGYYSQYMEKNMKKQNVPNHQPVMKLHCLPIKLYEHSPLPPLLAPMRFAISARLSQETTGL